MEGLINKYEYQQHFFKNEKNISSIFLLVSLSFIITIFLNIGNNNGDVSALSIAAVGDWGCTSQTYGTVKKNHV